MSESKSIQRNATPDGLKLAVPHDVYDENVMTETADLGVRHKQTFVEPRNSRA